jgi:Zn-dependent peptidase ImmA (M78 family)
MDRIPVNPNLLRWARERARIEPMDLMVRFPKLPAWENREVMPTLRQLESYARATHAPIGYFFLPEPPNEPLPIPDFRRMPGAANARPSPNLLDTIYVCQERQSWYRDYATVTGLEPLAFVGSLTRQTAPVEAAATIRQALRFDLDARRACATWTEALRQFIEQAERVGVLVMASGIVQNNTHRALDPEEFRGFALVDKLAPLVFLNGADSRSAQMFTLAHELAHVWLGASALSDASAVPVADGDIEVWCNRVAAELLVPMEAFRAALIAGEGLGRALPRLARQFKVSTLVVLRRLLDAGRITRAAFDEQYESELQRLADVPRGSGGDFYRTTVSRIGRRFGRALVESTLEGRTLFRDAYRMLGVSKGETFNELGRSLGFAV